MDLTEPETLRQQLMQAVDAAGPWPQERFSGRGVVICAGGAEILTNAYVLVRVLRDLLGCTLPIEIWHIGPREMPALLAGMFLGLGCTIVDALEVIGRHPADIRDGWQLKPYALVNSGFEEVILLDADQVPLIDPAAIFDWPEYRETGAVFWPDIIDLAPANPAWGQLGLEPRRMRSFETGQLCVNKKMHWQALAITLRMNVLAEHFYELVYGDKDTFLLAWLFVDAGFAFVPQPPMADARFLGQRDFAGNVVFQHRTNCKWSLLREPYLSDAFRLQDECIAILQDLGKRWNGREFTAPDRSAAARGLENRLVRQGRFILNVETEPPVEVELLPGHQFGSGRSRQLSNWCVRDAGDGHELVFYTPAFESFRFPLAGEGPWFGQTSSASSREAILRSLAAGEPAGAADQPEHTLADDFIDLALRTGDDISACADQLRGALQLLARMESDVAERVTVRAGECEPDQPSVARALREIAAQLPPSALSQDTRPDKRKAANLSNPERYLRP